MSSSICTWNLLWCPLFFLWISFPGVFLGCHLLLRPYSQRSLLVWQLWSSLFFGIRLSQFLFFAVPAWHPGQIVTWHNLSLSRKHSWTTLNCSPLTVYTVNVECVVAVLTSWLLLPAVSLTCLPENKHHSTSLPALKHWYVSHITFSVQHCGNHFVWYRWFNLCSSLVAVHLLTVMSGEMVCFARRC